VKKLDLLVISTINDTSRYISAIVEHLDVFDNEPGSSFRHRSGCSCTSDCGASSTAAVCRSTADKYNIKLTQHFNSTIVFINVYKKGAELRFFRYRPLPTIPIE
jgi:hypothetical protein